MTAAGRSDAATVGVLVRIWPKLSETFILEELLGLQRLGVPLRIYALAPPTDSLVHPAVSRVRAPVVTVPLRLRDDLARGLRRHARWLLTRPVDALRALALALRRGRQGLADHARAGWLAGQLAEDGVGHLHVHFISQPADIAELATRMSGLPYSISAHAKDIYRSPAPDLRRKLGSARFVVTCTECNRQALNALATGHTTLHRMYHGIDHAAFHPALRRPAGPVPLILSVGRLRSKKGLDTLLQACARLRDQGRRLRCEIVGYGEEQQRLQALIGSLDLAGHVQLTGALTREHVIERYARCSVYVQPSRIDADGDRDGIPNVLLEAMAMGLPVVASAVSGIPELVQDGRSGLLVAPDDPVQLANAIARVLDNPPLATRLGQGGRDAVLRDFDNDRNLRLLVDLLQPREAGHAAIAAA